MKFGLIGGSYKARTQWLDASRTINLYPEISKSPNSRNIAALYGTPGLILFGTYGVGGIRAGLKFSADLAIFVSGNSVYSVTAAGVGTLRGTISTVGSVPVGIAHNGITVMIVTGADGYTYTPGTAIFAQIVDPDFTGADVVQFIDAYFVFNQLNTSRIQITGLNATTVDPLDFTTADGATDLVVSVLVDHREIWVFGETSTEPFFNSGNAKFPFERIQGAFIEQGCAAKFSPAKIDNTVLWLAADERGQGVVQMAVGYQPRRISNHGVEAAIAKYSRIDDAIGYTYQQEGHTFYVLSFPTGNATWAYDTSTDEWHERAWRNPADGTMNRHLGQCHIAFAGKNLVGDWRSGNVYAMDLNTYTDNGDALPAIRQAPYVADGNRWVRHHKLWLNAEVGVGLNAGFGSDPQISLDWSDDGGNVWANSITAKLGKIGERMARVNFRRLGKSRARVYRVTLSDPVKRAFVDADVEVS